MFASPRLLPIPLALTLAALAPPGCSGDSTGDTGDSSSGGDSTSTSGTTGASSTMSTGGSTSSGSGGASEGSTTAATEGETETAGDPSGSTSTSSTTTDASDATTEGVSDSDASTTTTTEGSSGSTSEGTTEGTTTEGTTGDPPPPPPPPNPLLDDPGLWYSVDKALVYIQIDPNDGSVLKLVHNQLVPQVPLFHGQNGITMLEDGSLLGSRESAQGTQIYYIPNPPLKENSPAEALYLGMVPSDKGQPPPRIEALYTDCDGRVYLMDTGVDVSSATGNRLLRFKGQFLKGDLTYDVITDLEKASVADIDDMSPGLVNGEVNDKVGFAIDSTFLWRIDYTTGTGMNLAQTSGTWGVHLLGGPLFADQKPRLYVLSQNAALFQVNLQNYQSSQALVVGPNLMLQSGYNGWSGLAGPLTDCVTAIPQ